MREVTNTFALCVCLYVFSFSNLLAQINGGPIGYEPAQTIQDVQRIVEEDFIANECFEIFNVSLNKGLLGVNASIGSFSNGMVPLGMEEGMVIATAPISQYNFGNQSTATGGDMGVPGSDGDLINIDIVYGGPNPVPVNDMTTLQFDFTPTSESVRFVYVFASEEYCDYVGTAFNDKFGLFLGGPGINGPFTDNNIPKINLAEFIDEQTGQVTNVSINNVHKTRNSSLYVDNVTVDQAASGQGNCFASAANAATNPYTNLMAFDGYTVPLVAEFTGLQICETYTLKVIVADGSDQIFGSAVYFEAGSFNAAQGASSPSEITFEDTGEIFTYESCGDSVAVIQFNRDIEFGPGIEEFIEMPIELTGNATWGLDYCTDADVGLFPGGTVMVPSGGLTTELIVKSDDFDEGVEFINLSISNPCQCEPELFPLAIIDVPPIEVEPLRGDTACFNSIRNIRAQVEGGFPSVDRAMPPADYMYVWSDTSGTVIGTDQNVDVDISGLGFHTYYLEVSDGCGAVHMDTVTYLTTGIPNADLEGTYTICDESPEAILDITFEGLPPWRLTYTLDGVPQPPLIINDPNFQWIVDEIGTYEIIEIQGVACRNDVEGTAEVGNTSVAVDIMPTPTQCSDSEDGALRAFISDGTGTYTYQWSDDAGQTTEEATGLAPGTYTVTVTDELGCTQEFTAEVEAADDVVVTPELVSGTTCANLMSGEVSATGDGGAGGYTYNWSDAGGTSVGTGATIGGLSAGTYNVDIIDANGCQSTASIMIPSDENTPDAVAQNAVIDCNNSIVTIDTDGTSISTDGEFTYAWTVNTGGGSVNSDPDAPIATIDQPGTYILTVTNTTNGCTATAPFEVADNRVDPTADAGSGFDCITSDIQLGGSGLQTGDDITYQWTSISGGSIQGATDVQNPTVNEAGIYEVTVTNEENGCTSTDQVEVSVAPEVAIEVPASIDCRGDGTVMLSGLGSSTGSDISYAWTASNGGAIVSDGNTLNPIVSEGGTYTLVVSNAAGCTNEMPIEVDDIRTDMMADPGQTAQIDCNVMAVDLGGPNTSTGGNISYEWTISLDGGGSSTENTQNITATAAGTYTLLVTNNDNGCTATNQVAITENTEDPDVNIDTPALLTCEEDSQTLTASGSSNGGNFTYTWTTTDGSIISDANGQTVNIDDPGMYTLTIVNNDNGCDNSTSIMVEEDADFPEVSIVQPENIDCASTQVLLDGSGSESGPGIVYTWRDENGNVVSNDASFLASAAGEYILEVNNTLTGCLETARETVLDIREDPTADAGPVQNLNCEVMAVTLGGTTLSTGPEFTYEWTQTGTSFVSTMANPEITEGGEYVLVVTNTNNMCTSTISIDIPQDMEDPDVDADVSGIITCQEPIQTLMSDGSSTGPEFEYSWTGPNGFESNEQNPEIDESGDYTLIITNTSNRCVASTEITVDEDAEFPAIAIEDPAIVNCSNMIIELSGAGSEVGNDVTYAWTATNGGVIEDDEDTLNPEISAAGTYSLTVSNTATGCSRTLEVEVTEDFVPPVAMVNEDLTFGCQDTELQVTGAGSSTGANITYEWSIGQQGNISGQVDQLDTQIDQPGDYILVVTNLDNGCTAEASFEVTPDEALPDVALVQPETITCERDMVLIDATGSDSGTGLEYAWTKDGVPFTPNSDESFMTDEPGEYTLTITDTANGCVNSGTTIVDINVDPPTAIAGEIMTLNCRDMMLNLDADGSSAGTEYTYEWLAVDGGNIVSGGDTDEPLIDEPGMYILTVTNTETGCFSTDEVEVLRDDTNPMIQVEEVAVINCRDASVMIDASSSDQGSDFEFTWEEVGSANIESGEETLTPTVDEPGTYILTVVNNVNFCEQTFEVLVERNIEPPIAEILMPETLTCANETVSLLGTGSSTGPEFEYTWTSTSLGGSFVGATNSIDVEVDAPGTYELLVVNTENFCENIFVISVDQDIDAPTVATGNVEEVTCDEPQTTLSGAGSSTGPDFEYSWTPVDGGEIVSGGTTLTPTVNAPGDYVLTVLNTRNGCTSVSTQSVISNDEFPQDAITDPIVLTCTVLDQVLAGSGNAGLGYSWSTSNGNIVGATDGSQITVDEPGIYVMTVTNLDNGCSNPFQVEVFEDVEPPLAEAGPGSTLTCTETTVALLGEGSEGSIFAYEWTTTDGAISGASDNLEAAATASGTYTLTITNNENGCVSTDDVFVDVDENVPTGIDAESISPNCFGDLGAIVFNGVDGGVGPYDYSIDGGANFSDETLFSDLTPGQTYSLLISDNNGCLLEQDLTVPSVDSLSVQVAETFVEIELGEAFNINAFTSFPESEITSITWTPATGLSCTDCLNPEATPGNSINYNVVVVSENGCVDEANIQFRVDRNIDIYIPNAFSPHNLDGINDLFAPLGKPGLIATVREFQIFDRWGDQVYEDGDFELNAVGKGWDGVFRNDKLQPGVFAYYVILEYVDGSTELFEGDVTLMD